MDTLTHALSGALLARATAPKPAPDTLPVLRRVAVGMMAAAFPDLDFITGYFGDLAYLYHHRGVTHSLIMLPLWALLIAWLCALIWRRDRSWRAYFGVAALGVGIHIVGDLITAYGTMVFAPLSDVRVGIGTTFIIDLWFTGIIVAGLVASAVWRSSPVPAIAGLAVLCSYIAFQGVLQQEAVRFGEAYAQSAGLKDAQVSAQPRPVSPHNWMVVVRNGEDVRYSFVNLARREAPRLAPDAGYIARLDAAYLPLTQAQWVRASRFGVADAERKLAREAWQQPRFEFFRWFAEHPVLLHVDSDNPSTCVWFQDLRFFTPGRDRFPFRYGLCRDGGGPWQPYQLVGETARVPVF